MPRENLQIEGKWTSLVGEGKTKEIVMSKNSKYMHDFQSTSL